jgi:hypothetical protein
MSPVSVPVAMMLLHQAPRKNMEKNELSTHTSVLASAFHHKPVSILDAMSAPERVGNSVCHARNKHSLQGDAMMMNTRTNLTEQQTVTLYSNTKPPQNRTSFSFPPQMNALRRIRLPVLLVLLLALVSAGKAINDPNAESWTEYVRVSALDEHDSPALNVRTETVMHRAGWIWDLIDAIEEYLEVGKENETTEEPNSDDPDINPDSGEGEGEGEGEGDGDGEGGEGEGDGGEGEGGSDPDGEGEGGEGDGDGDPQEQNESSEVTREDVIAIICMMDETFEYTEDLTEEELTVILLELLDYLYSIAE